MSNKMNLPWRLGRGGYIINKRGDVIAESFANDAAHIIRCVNAHDGLVEALQKLACLGNGDQYGNSDGNCIAIAALTKAQGDQE